MTSSVIKVFNGYPCAHRQWAHAGHCSKVHGYQRRFVCTFVCELLDNRGWVIDFGGEEMKAIRKMLDSNFDHTLLVASDDPAIKLFREHDGDLWKLIELPYGPGMEGTARFVLEYINECIGHYTPGLLVRKVRCTRVEVWENEKNCGAWDAQDPRGDEES